MIKKTNYSFNLRPIKVVFDYKNHSKKDKFYNHKDSSRTVFKRIIMKIIL